MLRDPTDNMSSTTPRTRTTAFNNEDTPKIPAWKLRRQQLQQNREVPVALYVNDELGSSRSSRSNRGSSSLQEQQQKFRKGRYNNNNYNYNYNCSDTGSIASAGSTRSTSSLSTTSTRSTTSSFYSSRSNKSRSSNASCHISRTIRPVSRVPGGFDPLVPPAFRAAQKWEQQQHEKKNHNCLASSVASHARTDATTTSINGGGSSDLSSLEDNSDNDFDDDDDFDDENSFASIGSNADEEDDDAYQVSRNQMAQFTIENMPQRRRGDRQLLPLRPKKSRFQTKTTGVHGTPLGLIAE